ncbi:MAG: SpoIIIAH-like family protein [Syntrophomonadaceae bacterium]|nr:SpoIIIAH-like family protein [Syntrophomonadaceae bacterium]
MMVINLKRIITGIVVLIAIVIMVSMALNIKTPEEKSPDSIQTPDISNGDVDISTIPRVAKADMGEDFFIQYRLEREQMRGKQVELLQGIYNNESLTDEARQSAALRLVDISTDMEREMKAENLVKSNTGEDCAVVIQADSMVVVVASQLSEARQQSLIDLLNHQLVKGTVTVTTLLVKH